MADVLALIRELRLNGENPCLDFNGDGKSSIKDALDLLLYIARH
jgi:hypothetical protein